MRGAHGASMVQYAAFFVVIALLYLGLRDTAFGDIVSTQVNIVRERVADVIYQRISDAFGGSTGELP